MSRRRELYGDVFSSRFPIFGRVVYVAEPELVKQVFRGDPAVFHAGEANALALGDALGEHSLSDSRRGPSPEPAQAAAAAVPRRERTPL